MNNPLHNPQALGLQERQNFHPLSVLTPTGDRVKDIDAWEEQMKIYKATACPCGCNWGLRDDNVAQRILVQSMNRNNENKKPPALEFP